MFQRFNYLVLVFFVIGCSKPLPTLQNFDTEKWKADKNGCDGERKLMLASIESQRSELLGYEELQLVELLGRPDQNELSKRNQKFYFYFIDPAPICVDNDGITPKKLTIRFTAMGLAKEVLIE
jgi:hypothetical protein